MLVVRVDTTVIEAASPKAQGGFGSHPLTSWCSNIGDALAVMQRPGNAGSFTAADHIAADGRLERLVGANVGWMAPR